MFGHQYTSGGVFPNALAQQQKAQGTITKPPNAWFELKSLIYLISPSENLR